MRFAGLAAASLLTISLAILAGSASASDERSKFDFHVADAFIQSGIGLAQTGAVAEAANHHQVRLTGRGTLNLEAKKKASGSGSFVHTDASGAVQGFGTWTARSVKSATMYPCGGNGLPNNFCGGHCGNGAGCGWLGGSR